MRSSQLKLLGCYAAALLLVVSGCGSAPGIDPVSTSDYASSDCGRCVQEACSSMLESCGAERGCIGYLLCLGHCPNGADGDADAGCEVGCRARAALESQSTISALAACRSSAAENNCPACNVGGQKHGLFIEMCKPADQPPGLSECSKCGRAQCCESAAACDNDKACAAILEEGRTLCPDTLPVPDQTKCILQKYANHPDGRKAFRIRNACFSTRCSAECQGIPDPSEPQKRLGCLTCSAKYCPEQLLASNTAEPCLNALSCPYTCGASDMACLTKCLADVLACNTYTYELVQCEQHYCLAECPAT